MGKKSSIKLLRVTFLGSPKVGKSSLIQRVIHKTYTNEYQATIGDYYNHFVRIDGRDLTLEIADTSGENNFPAMEKHATENSDVVVVVFSLDDIDSWHRAITICNNLNSQNPSLPVVVVGNKRDIRNRKCPYKRDIEDYITCVIQKAYVEMSAKKDTTDLLLRRIYEEYEIVHEPICPKKLTKFEKLKTISKSITG